MYRLDLDLLLQYQLAEALGKGQSTVSETLTLNNLPEDIRSATRTNANLPKLILIDAAKMESDFAMRKMIIVNIY